MHAVVCASLVLLISAGSALAQTHSNARGLGIPADHDQSTIAYGVNIAGQVAAVLEEEDGRLRALRYEKGKPSILGTLGGDYSEARAINSKGELVGSSQDKDRHWRAFIYDRAAGMRDLGTLGGPSSYGMAINHFGAVTGFADNADGNFHAFLYTPAVGMIDLGTLGGKISYATAMNIAGQVVGAAQTSEGYRHAFLYDAARGMVDLGTLGGRQSIASSINDAGHIVGASETKTRRWHAFLYDGKRMVDLGALAPGGNSFANGINNAGHVVGTYMTRQTRGSFVWRDGKMHIHREGKGLHLTNGISETGQVIGATYAFKYAAATMASDALPIIDSSVSPLLIIAGIATAACIAGAVHSTFFRRDAMHGLGS
jgi:probable HAF family extracellular repeat protein